MKLVHKLLCFNTKAEIKPFIIIERWAKSPTFRTTSSSRLKKVIYARTQGF